MFEAELKQNVNKIQELKDKLTELLEENPDAPEAPRWKQMLTDIGMWPLIPGASDRSPGIFKKNHNLYQKKISDSFPDFEICFHISESIFAISEVEMSFHVVWGWALAYLLFFSLSTVTKFIFTKKVDTS